MRTRALISAGTLALVGLALPVLTMTTAQADPASPDSPYASGSISIDSWALPTLTDAACDVRDGQGDNSVKPDARQVKPVVGDAPASTLTTTAGGSLEGFPAVATLATAGTTAASLTTALGGLSTMDFQTSMSAAIDYSDPTSDCLGEATTVTNFGYTFVVAHAGTLYLTVQQTSPMLDEIDVQGNGTAFQQQFDPDLAPRFQAIPLSPGTYSGEIFAASSVNGDYSGTSSVSTGGVLTVHAAFRATCDASISPRCPGGGRTR